MNNVLWFTNFNLNEVLFNSKFNFHDEIEKYNENKYIDFKESDDDFLKNWMEKMYVFLLFGQDLLFKHIS